MSAKKDDDPILEEIKGNNRKRAIGLAGVGICFLIIMSLIFSDFDVAFGEKIYDQTAAVVVGIAFFLGIIGLLTLCMGIYQFIRNK